MDAEVTDWDEIEPDVEGECPHCGGKVGVFIRTTDVPLEDGDTLTICSVGAVVHRQPSGE